MRWIARMLAMALFALPGLAAAGPDDPDEAHDEADKNDDGFVDRREYHSRMVEIFYHGDSDKDGFLGRAELAVMNEEVLIVPADSNKDGKLNLYEFTDQRFELFNLADTDKDGLLTVEEVEAYVDRQ